MLLLPKGAPLWAGAEHRSCFDAEKTATVS
jgi:hypothetical protein